MDDDVPVDDAVPEDIVPSQDNVVWEEIVPPDVSLEPGEAVFQDSLGSLTCQHSSQAYDGDSTGETRSTMSYQAS